MFALGPCSCQLRHIAIPRALKRFFSAAVGILYTFLKRPYAKGYAVALSVCSVRFFAVLAQELHT